MPTVAAMARLDEFARRICFGPNALVLLAAAFTLAFAVVGVHSDSGAAETYVRGMRGIIEARARQFQVDAQIPFGQTQCHAMPGGRACVVSTVPGIVLNILEKDGRVIATQLAVSRASVRDQKNIGRAINALFLVGLPASDQRAHDLMSMAGAMCILSGFSNKSGPVKFEATTGGCVITIDRP